MYIQIQIKKTLRQRIIFDKIMKTKESQSTNSNKWATNKYNKTNQYNSTHQYNNTYQSNSTPVLHER